MGDFTYVLGGILYFVARLLELVNGHEIQIINVVVNSRTGTSKHPKGT